jgi:hypothetical protein
MILLCNFPISPFFPYLNNKKKKTTSKGVRTPVQIKPSVCISNIRLTIYKSVNVNIRTEKYYFKMCLLFIFLIPK